MKHSAVSPQPAAQIRSGARTPLQVLPKAQPEARGPALFIGDRKFVAKGVTYGTFAANSDGELLPAREVVRSDFAQISAAGVNTVRTYTTPPAWFLEEARSFGLRVLAGIYWDMTTCRLDDPELRARAEAQVRAAARIGRQFPDVVLAYVIANEIPPLIVRFHGWRTVERLIRHLFDVCKEEDPNALVTYGNYPTTEYLQLDFLDFQMLNVFLLEPKTFGAYLDRIMIECKGKPLLLGELGDDSLHKSEDKQAELLDWMIPMALDKGVSGLCVFSWTDDWVVGGDRVSDWAFGIVDRQRHAKPALEVVTKRFAEHPLQRRQKPWPKVSVVICNYNGGSTLDETLSSLVALDYADYEVIYVDDGSTDDSLQTAQKYAAQIKIVAQANQGLSAARNRGLDAAEGDIVAYIDSDAFADPEWLRFLVLAMESGEYAGAGGPNLTPKSDGLIAQFIATCPGNPTYVLKDNVHADHIAGVNMAFRREALLSINGFDPIHTKAGDDVDICWRLEDAGMRLAFSPAAIVWHHRRPSVTAYLKQQFGYGEAEDQLERKHPERFNLAGYIRWGGRVYLAPKRTISLLRPFIYHGPLGSALFQTLYQKDPSYLADVPVMIQWYIAALGLMLLGLVSPWFLFMGVAMLAISMWRAFLTALTTQVPVSLSRQENLTKLRIVGSMHFLHPLVRSAGRLVARLRSRRGGPPIRLRWWRPRHVLNECRQLWQPGKQVARYWGTFNRIDVIREIKDQAKNCGFRARLGESFDNFDLSVGTSLVAEGRVFTSPENFEQSLCIGFKTYPSGVARLTIAGFVLLALVAIPISAWLCVSLLLLAVVASSYVLASRARLRARVWQAIDVCMQRRNAPQFEDDER